MKRRIALAVGGAVAIFVCAAVYGIIFPSFGSRATVSFLGYSRNEGQKLAIFQLMNHSRQNLAVLPRTFFLARAAGGMIAYTNEQPEIFGDVPPGILQAQTSATFAVGLPSTTNAWCFEMECREFRQVHAWEVTARRMFRKIGLPWIPNKSYLLRTPELEATITNGEAK